MFKFQHVYSFGRGNVRTPPRAVHADHEAQYSRLRRTDAQNLRITSEHPRHSMNCQPFSNPKSPNCIHIKLLRGGAVKSGGLQFQSMKGVRVNY